MSLGPFDLTGGPFLALYILLLVATIVAGLAIPRRLRPEGRIQRVTDIDQLAYLAGGRARFWDAVVARLLASNALAMIGRDTFSVDRRMPEASPAERAVLTLSSPAKWGEIELALRNYTAPLEQKMIVSGLLVSNEARGNLRFWATLPYAMLIVFGATKWIIGDMRDRPVGYLSALLVVTAIFAIVRWFSIDRRTRAGLDAVAHLRDQSDRLRKAPTNSEIGIAVALFGTTVLVGSGFSDFHRLRSASSGGDGGSGGSDGGGGGCGGGCGGCGG
jgi:uncharacterized protein (TIGR04222 family)